MANFRREKTNTAILRRYHQNLTISEDQELEAIRAAYIYEEQRFPTDEEQQLRHCDLIRLGSLLPRFLRRLKENNSRSVFELEQQQWTHLAGESSRFWRLKDGKQKRPDKPLYAPLHEESREIRVLQVSRLSPVNNTPGLTTPNDNSNQAFKANLLHVSLHDDPPYIAISYAWGDSSPVGRFRSDQEGAANFEYNRAVFDILNALLPEASTLYLWIDALCINQNDDSEKGIQVALMGDVFGKARQVVIFLGEADEGTTTNMDLLYQAGPVVELKFQVPFNDDGVDMLEVESIKAGIPIQAWRSAHCLVSRRWFTRYWVIQELALGTCPLVTCGRHAVSWDLLSTVCNWIYSSGTMIVGLVDRSLPNEGRRFDILFWSQPWPNLGSLNNIRRRGGSLLFWWMINNFDIFEVQNPRDRVFAITGLKSPSEVEEEESRSNYKISVDELYTKVTRRLLARDAGVFTLYRAGVGFPRSLNLSSRVPDWTSRRNWTHLHTQPTELYPVENVQLRVELDQDFPRVVTLRGCIVDFILRQSAIKDRQSRMNSLIEHPGAGRHWTDSVLELLDSYTPAIDFSTACCDSPIGDPGWKYCLCETLAAGRQERPFEECVFDRYLERQSCFEIASKKAEPRVEEAASRLDLSIRISTFGRRFFVSSKGYFGLTSPETQEGDLVCVFEVMITPIIIRLVEPECPDDPSTPESYILLGEAYHHGIAKGELELEPEFMGPIRLV